MIDKYLEKAVRIILKKYDENLTIEDLEKIEELNLNYYDIFEEKNIIKIEELQNFKNLRRLSLAKFCLSKEDIRLLGTLNYLYSLNLNNCTIENEEDISELSKLTSIELRNMKINSLSFCNNLKNLKKLSLRDSQIKYFSDIKKCIVLEYLDIEGIGNLNLDFLLYLDCLKLINVSRQQLTEYNLKILKELEKRHEFSYKIEMKNIY